MQRRNSKWSLLVGSTVTLVACAGPAPAPGEEEPVEQASQAVTSSWTQIQAPFPGATANAKSPGNVALLPDGRVLASGPETSNSWYTLTPDASGSYRLGTWTQVASSHFGTIFGPSFVLRDGHYLLCGGEYAKDDTENELLGQGKDRAHCEFFDPVTNLWTVVPDMPQTVADTPATVLADGRVLNLSYVSSNSYLYSPTTNQWTTGPSYDKSAINTEGDCLLLQDSSAFCGITQFRRFVTSPDRWVDTAPTPSWPTNVFAAANGGEIGPFLLLHSGKVMVLGGNTKNGIYTPPKGATPDSWVFAADTPGGYNHGDSPSAVEANGNLLTVVTTDPNGSGLPGPDAPPGPNGNVALYEYTTATDTWAAVTPPPFANGASLGAGNRMRLLNLPQQSATTARVLLTGTTDGSIWVYGSANTPAAGWRPTITSIGSPSNGVYKLTGTQLNGLTIGSNFGDDARMGTNYPLVYLVNGSSLYYARTSTFDQMAPRPGQTGSCNFTLPPSLPNGTYQVHVSANGVDSSNTPSLTVNETHVSNLTGNLTGDVGSMQTWTVTLSSAAPTGGTVVKLASSAITVATVPASVTVLAGKTTATFSLTVSGFGISTISAVKSGNAAFGPMTANFGWNLNDLTGANIPYYGNDTQSTFTLTTSRPAPSGGLVVKLDSSNTGIASVPATVTVQGGQNTATFPVTRTLEGIALIKASLVGSFITKAVKTADRPRLPNGDGGANMSFFKCADEGGTCPVGGPPRYLAYGANGSYNFQSASGAVPCNNAQFGDPAVNQTKACYFSSYGYLGAENATVTVGGQLNIAYGANGRFVFKDMQGSFVCDNATFTDPIPGPTKACYYGPLPYTFMASEGGTFNVTPNVPVAYGGGGTFAFKILSGSIACTNATFGDPAPGTSKSCYALPAPFAVDESQPFSTTGAAGMYYGSGLNGNFAAGGYLSGTCSNAFFGLDPDVTRTKHCYGR